MSERSRSPNLRSLSSRSPPPRGRSHSPHSRSPSSRSYSRPRSRSRSYSRRRRSRSRSRSPYHNVTSGSNNNNNSNRSYGRYYSRSPPPPLAHHRRSPPPSRRYNRSRSPPPPRRSSNRPSVNKECKVYVGNLPYEVTSHQLKDFMRDAGQVAHVNVLKTPAGRSKGCGIVEYRYPEDAKRAIHTMNKAEFMGRPVFVREDREHEHAGPSKDPRDVPDDCRLSVSNLPLNASWQDMKDLFRKAGRVLHTDVYTESGSRRSNGNGTVIFDDHRTAQAAIDMFDGYEWQGSRLKVTDGRHVDNSRSSSSSRISRLPPPLEDSSSRIDTAPPIHSGNNNNRLPMMLPPDSSAANYNVDLNNNGYMPPPPQQQQPTSHTALLSQTNIDPSPYQNTYSNRYGPPEPAPPIMYSKGLVGGPAANLPTHGHNQIFVNNLPFSTTWQDLIDLFRHVGPVVRSEIVVSNGHPKGSGFVRFEDAITCERAIGKFNGYNYGGRQLDIRLDRYSTTL